MSALTKTEADILQQMRRARLRKVPDAKAAWAFAMQLEISERRAAQALKSLQRRGFLVLTRKGDPNDIIATASLWAPGPRFWEP